jgi:uncharacterized protein (DUF58 family)
MIEPDFLTDLDRLQFALDRRADSLQHGPQRSTKVGEGLVFSDHRQYSPGDDIRRIDWKVSARTEDLYVTQYETERNMTVHALVDASASMDFGDPGPGGTTHKFEYAAKLGLGFATMAAGEHNRFQVGLFTDEARRVDDGRSTRGTIVKLIDGFNETDPAGTGSFADALPDYASTIDSRSLILIASDFLDDPDALQTALSAFGDHEVVLAQVLTPEELDPSVEGEMVFVDAERGDEVRTYFGTRTRERYHERLDAYVDAVEEIAHMHRARHTVVDTGRDFFDAFTDVWVG